MTTHESMNTELEGVDLYVECTRYAPVRNTGDDFEVIEDVTVFAGETDITSLLSEKQIQEIALAAYEQATPISGNGAYRVAAQRALSEVRNISPREQSEMVAFGHE